MNNQLSKRPVTELLRKQKLYSISIIIVYIIILACYALFLYSNGFNIYLSALIIGSIAALPGLVIWILNIINAVSINSITKKDVGIVISSVLAPGLINLILIIAAERREKTMVDSLKSDSDKTLKEEDTRGAETRNTTISNELRRLLDKQVSLSLALLFLSLFPIVGLVLWILSIINASEINAITNKGTALLIITILFPWLINLILAITTRNKILREQNNNSN